MTIDALRQRWLTSHGMDLRGKVVEALRRNENFAAHLLNFPGSNEIEHHADLRGIVLTDMLLDAAELTCSALDYATFDGCDLTSANFHGSSMKGSSFRYANLSKASLVQVSAEHGCFESAKLINVFAMTGVFEHASFQDACMNSIALSGAKCRYADFRGAQLIEADFNNADLSFAKLSGAVLAGVTAWRAKIDGIDIFWQPTCT